MFVKRYKLPVIKWINSGYLIISVLTVINNTVLYAWKLLWEQIFKVLATNTPTQILIMWGDKCASSLYHGNHFTINKYIKSSGYTL